MGFGEGASQSAKEGIANKRDRKDTAKTMTKRCFFGRVVWLILIFFDPHLP